jgi:steroid delta-isomerase-like uncharacterized protein
MNLELKVGVLATTVLLSACGGQSGLSRAVATAPHHGESPATGVPDPQREAPISPASAKATREDLQKRTVGEWFSAFNAHDAKRLATLYQPDAPMGRPAVGGWAEVKASDEAEKSFAMIFESFPDLKAAAARVYQGEDVVVVEWAAAGTNDGEFFGAPTHKKTAVWGCDLLWLAEDGRIKREDTFRDDLTIMQQLGKAPGRPRELGAWPEGGPRWLADAGAAATRDRIEMMKRTWPTAWTTHDSKAYGALLNEDCEHDDMSTAVDYKGRAALLKELDGYVASLPDLRVTIDRAWAFDSNVVVAEFTLTGTMKGRIGPFRPTNKEVVMHGLDIDELRDGKLQRAITYSNGLEFLAAVGAIPKLDAVTSGSATPAAIASF